MNSFSPRPHRLVQIHQDYIPPLYFVTFCTANRQPVLACDGAHRGMVRYAEKAMSMASVAVGRYVIMPDHVHLFIRGPDGFQLGVWIRGLKQSISKALECGVDVPIHLRRSELDVPIHLQTDADDRRMETSAPHRHQQKKGLWQEGLFDHIIRHSESYREKWEYVWQNPVRAGLVKNAEEWPYQGEISVIDRA